MRNNQCSFFTSLFFCVCVFRKMLRSSSSSLLRHKTAHGPLNQIQRQVATNLWKEFQIANPQLITASLHFTFHNIDSFSSPVDYPQDNRFASKLGGLPFHPRSYPWNKTEFGNLRLLAQFNLSKDLTREQRSVLNFPREGGMLQFFIHPDNNFGLHEDQEEPGPATYQVRFWENQVLESHSNHDDDDAASKLLDLSEFHKPLPSTSSQGPEAKESEFPLDNHIVPRFITFNESGITKDFGGSSDQKRLLFRDFLWRNEHSVKSTGNVRDKMFAAGLNEQDFDKMFDAVRQDVFGGVDPNLGCKLGGQPAFFQSDIRSQLKDFLKLDKGPSLIVQFASGGDLKLIDDGVMHFFINSRQDLVEGNVDNTCYYNWDCASD